MADESELLPEDTHQDRGEEVGSGVGGEEDQGPHSGVQRAEDQHFFGVDPRLGCKVAQLHEFLPQFSKILYQLRVGGLVRNTSDHEARHSLFEDHIVVKRPYFIRGVTARETYQSLFAARMLGYPLFDVEDLVFVDEPGVVEMGVFRDFGHGL